MSHNRHACVSRSPFGLAFTGQYPPYMSISTIYVGMQNRPSHCGIAMIVKDNYTSVMTCAQASVGRQHAVLVTRGGELFTWGSGHGGKLGLGHMMDAPSPQRVHTLWGQSIKHVAAGG